MLVHSAVANISKLHLLGTVDVCANFLAISAIFDELFPSGPK